MFFPLSRIPGKLFYSIGMQWKGKIFKGNFKVLSPLHMAIWDLLTALPKLISNRNKFTSEEYANYVKLNEAKIYWKPEK